MVTSVDNFKMLIQKPLAVNHKRATIVEYNINKNNSSHE